METIKYIESEPSSVESSNLEASCHRLHIHVGSRRFVPPEEIQHLESDLNYTLISLADGKKILSSTTLKKIESRLMQFKNFVRVNKSAIVNLDFVENYEQTGFKLPDERILVFSRRQKKRWQSKSSN